MNRETNRPFGRYRDKYTLVAERQTAGRRRQINSIGIPTTTMQPPGLRAVVLVENSNPNVLMVQPA
jgi:hypothetical protein